MVYFKVVHYTQQIIKPLSDKEAAQSTRDISKEATVQKQIKAGLETTQSAYKQNKTKM